MRSPIHRRLLVAFLCVLACKRAPQVTMPEAAAPTPPPIAAPRTPPVGTCRDGWCWESPLPTGDDLVAVSVGGPRDVWIAGNTRKGSTLLHWTDAWTPTYLTVHVTALQRFAPGDIWAVTSEGGALHFDGTAWQPSEAPAKSPLRAMWGARTDDVWAVGDEGTIIHFDGAAWRTVPSSTKAALKSIHGLRHDDVWAVGDGGVVEHWNGRRWSVAHVVRPLRVEAPVRGEGPEFCGTSQLMAEYRAKDSASLTAVAAVGPSDVWIAAGAERMVHFDGKSWQDSARASRSITAFSVESKNSVWAVGADLSHWDGTAWKVARKGDALRAVGASGAEAWAVGDAGRMLVRDGTGWRRIDDGPLASNVAWVGADGDVWAGSGGIGEILHRDNGWKSLPLGVDGVVSAIAGRSEAPPDGEGLWVFTTAGHALRRVAGAWIAAPSPSAGMIARAYRGAGDEVWAVIREGTSLFHNGEWRLIDGALRPIDLWVGGKDATWAIVTPRDALPSDAPSLARWDGSAWARGPQVGTARALTGIAPNDLWLAGKDSVLHGDGTKLDAIALPTPSESPIRSIVVASSDEWWVTHPFAHYRAGTWLDDPPPSDQHTLVGSGRHLYAFGRGTIAHYVGR